MGKFKMKSPYKVDPIARYDVPFTPDNVEDNSGLVAKANKNGTMIVNKNIPKSSKLYKEAKSHEDQHLKDMMDNKLDYDSQAVYHNLDGKGVKRVDRKNFDESDKNLPWEKRAYKAGVAMKEQDMRPNPDKLDGPPNMQEKDTPLSYYKIGTKPRRESDMDSVSMNERFGNAMIKKFGPSKTGCAISKYGGPAKINIGPETDPSGEGEDEKKLKQKAQQMADDKLAKMEYQSEVLPDGSTRYFKSTEATASGADSVVPGSKAKVVPPSKRTTDPEGYIQKLIDSGKTREEVIEGSLTSSKYYDLFPSSQATATASDEYFEYSTSEKEDDGEENNGGGDETITTTNGDKKKKKTTLDFNLGKRRRRGKTRGFKRPKMAPTKVNTFKCPFPR